MFLKGALANGLVFSGTTVRITLALVYTGLGEIDQAFKWLEKAYDDRMGWLIWLNVEPKWDSIRSDGRFTDLLKRIGLAAATG